MTLKAIYPLRNPELPMQMCCDIFISYPQKSESEKQKKINSGRVTVILPANFKIKLLVRKRENQTHSSEDQTSVDVCYRVINYLIYKAVVRIYTYC